MSLTVNPTGAPSAPSAPSAAGSAGASGTTSAADQQDRFMKLLVAQMKNQDPLNPMDNAQMTSQIAQINTVAGLEKLNTTVGSLLSAFSGLQDQSATNLVGRDVLVAGNQLALAGGHATGGVELPAAADAVQVQIVDAAGSVVRTLALGATAAGVHSFAWDGQTDAGAAAPEGKYTLRVAATAAGKAAEAKALTAARVQSVAPGTAGVQLDLGALGQQPLAAIKSYL